MGVPAKFVKLMMMTSSENDAEALVALRKANAMLAEADVNWEGFLTAVDASKSVVPTQAKPPARRPSWEDSDGFSDVGRDARGHSIHFVDADDINSLFEKAFANTPRSSSFRNFLDSVHTWWEGNGFLTEKQYSAIRRAATKR